jgi:putative polyketide hydroxylase
LTLCLLKDRLSDEMGRTTMETPVLIVGGGPAGLAAAATLARHGVRPLVVERRRRPSIQPKATALSTRTMEVLRGWGLAGEVRAGGDEVEWRLLVVRTLTDREGQVFDLGMPSAELSMVISPERPAGVPQHHLEAVLERHVTRAGVAVLRGVEVVSVSVGPDGARAVLRDAATGAERTVAASYLVAADGVHGFVRRALGIGARGEDRLDEGLGVLLHAPITDRRYGIYAVDDGVFLPAGPPDRWFYAMHWPPGEPPPPAALTEEALIARIRAGAGLPGLDVRIVRIGRTEFGTRLADRFRRDSAFLIGDAAHRVTPRGGTGLNMAVQDGVNLGWKLAWVLRGLAGPDLLDTYEAERRPVAVHNTVRSTDPDGSRRGVAEELAVDLGGRIAHVPLPDGRSTVDLPGAGLTLIAESPADRWRAAATPGPMPVEVHGLGPLTVRALGVPAGSALLVRPDAVPAAVLGHPAEVTGAVAALAGRSAVPA